MVLFLNQGLIEEYDSPKKLLKNKSSSLAQLVAEYTRELSEVVGMNTPNPSELTMLSSTHTCLSPFSNSYLKIPSTTYTHSVSVVTPQEPSPNATEVKKINIELHVQGWYKLYVEPTRGFALLTMDEDYLVSPKFTCNFKLPLFLSLHKETCDSCVKDELDKLLLPSPLAHYLRPFIVETFLGLARETPAQFKVVFDVKIVNIDLTNYQECDYYRRHGLV